MNIKCSLGGPLKENKEREFELLVSYRREIGRVYYFDNDLRVDYGRFIPHFEKLNSQMQYAQDEFIRNYVRKSKKA